MATARTKRKKYDGPTAEEKLTQSLIELLEKGTSPWRKEWRTEAGQGRHANLITGNPYMGANPALLEMYANIRGHELNLWAGAGQAKAKGWWPKKGSKCAYVVRPQLNSYEQHDEHGEPIKAADGSTLISSWVSYKPAAVFNVGDLAGKTEADQAKLEQLLAELKGSPVDQPEVARIEAAERVLGGWCDQLAGGCSFEGQRAFYNSGADLIKIPARNRWTDPAALAATWAHECIHSTGHSSRLNRKLGTGHGSQDYAREELVAELGAFLLCNRLQISSCAENHAAYLDCWRGVLKEGPKVLFKVLSDATKAANLIAGPEVQE